MTASPSTAPKKPRWVRLKEVLPHAWRIARPRVPAMIAGLAFLAASRLASLALPAATHVFVDEVVGQGRTARLADLATWILGGAVVQALAAWALHRLLTVPTLALVAELRIRIIEHLLRLRVAFFDSAQTGALLPRVMNDVDGLRILFGSGFVEFAGSVFFAGFAAAYMWLLSPPLALVAGASILVFSLALGWAFWGFAPAYAERSRLIARTSGRLSEAISGIRVIKLFRAEDARADALAEDFRSLRDNAVRSATHDRRLAAVNTLVLAVLAVGVFAMAAREIAAGRLTLGEFMTFAMLLGFLASPVYVMVAVASQFADALVSIERVQQILDESPEGGVQGTERPASLRGDLAVEDLRFSYRPGVPVLHGVSFAAAAGTSVALVGPSGGGKSTLVALIARFYEPDAGTIRVDGRDAAALPVGEYRRALGVVPQDTFLFDASVRDNVRVARPDATDDAVAAACRDAHLDEFASRLPEGYDTVVGERGVRLSGGQKQRVAIARALLADPRILLLDEATSSLDADSERYVQDSLARLMAGRTTVAIAHRLSTIRRCDQILVVEGGRITARGTHEVLLRESPWYRASVTRQRDDAAAEVWV
jgi:subfamily B ATP-binding cassette protein MsbA